MKKFITLFSFFCFFAFSALAQAPVNDECSGAIPVPVNASTDCTQFAQSDITNATLSPLNPPFFNSEKDVWFKFVANSKIHKINVYDFAAPQGNSEKLRIEIAFGSADLCNPIYYYDAGLATDTLGFAFDFEIGGEYVVKISTFSEPGASGVPLSNFKICMTTPVQPVNKSCDKSKILNVPTNGTPLLVTGNNENVPYQFLPIDNCTSSNPEKILWYQFKATQNAYSIKFTKAAIFKQVQSLTYTLRIIEGDSCWSQNTLYCKVNDGFNTNPLTTYQSDQFIAGKNYFIMVSSQFYSPMAFDFTIAAIQNSPPNDLCANAIPLVINDFGSCAKATNGSTGNFSPSETLCYSLNTFNGDVWYSFVATKTKHIISISNKSPDDDLHFSVLQGNCNALYEAGTCYEKDKIELKKLIVGEKYFVVVSNNGNFANFTNHTFSLCVQEGTPPPPNDNPNNATVLEINPTLSIVKSKPGDLTTATNSGIATCAFPNNVEIDVFYTFTATNKQHLLQFFNIKRLTNFSINLEMAMMDNNLNEIFCNNSVIMDSTMFFSNLEVGKKYILRVFSNDIYSFDVAVSTPPAPPVNDICTAAITLTPSNDWACKNPVSGTTYWATQDDATSNFQGYGVWYSFTATSTKHSIYLENIVGITNNNLDIRLLVGKNPCDLDNLVYASGTPNNPVSILSSLEIGKKYYINVQSFDVKDFAFFDICITTPTTIFSNETCKNAVNLKVNPTEQIVDFIKTSSNFAQFAPLLPFSGSFSEFKNVATWYKFTATSTQHILHFLNIEDILGSGNGNLEFDPFEGSCDSLILSKILSNVTSNSVNKSITIATTIGKTYWIKTSSYNTNYRANFNLAVCSASPPLNDECSGAFEVKVAPTTKAIYPQDFTYRYATDSSGNYGNSDLWYHFTAKQTHHTIQFKKYSPSIIRIFKGNCNNVQFIKELKMGTDTMAVVANLQVGEKYLLDVPVF